MTEDDFRTYIAAFNARDFAGFSRFYADDVDARLQMMIEALENDGTEGFVTSKKNLLGQKIFKGLPPGA